LGFLSRRFHFSCEVEWFSGWGPRFHMKFEEGWQCVLLTEVSVTGTAHVTVMSEYNQGLMKIYITQYVQYIQYIQYGKKKLCLKVTLVSRS
jgi:hypothetical protein